MDFPKLNETELKEICPEIMLLAHDWNVDRLGNDISISLAAEEFVSQNPDILKQPGPMVNFRQKFSSRWAEIKNEFNLFICLENPKYADLRQKINLLNTAAIVSAISAEMAPQLATCARYLSPQVALMLYSILKGGTNEWWNTSETSSCEPLF
jgi:hypothetical protein